ncbi:hypothetical protein BGW38_002904 [Lunasporangiospora selenospora]|uniref:Uncharacterized protein n=1 Tax=Lunasporangiospora selenospora TaxID=979761 RepID=A0A9P6G1F6_9FUNG|nr:hypothetical protein BGW38_002904 [Lunasporangiospora selenospora]
MVFVDSVVGFTSLILGISSLISPSQVPSAKVRIHIQSGKVSEDSGGNIPAVWLQDDDYGDIGSYTNWNFEKLKKNYYWNHDIQTTKPTELALLNVIARYTRYDSYAKEMRSGPLNDAICIAYMSWSPDNSMFNADTRRGAILGDHFYHCGYDWYPSGKYKRANGQDYEMRCGWIDGDNSSGNSVHATLLNTGILGHGHIENFYGGKGNIKDVCGWGIAFSQGALPRKRSASETFGNKAYITAGEGAVAICDSPTAWGPSMLSLSERIFCDMETKTKIPLCREDQTTGCMKYDRSLGKKNALGRRGLPKRSLAPLNVSREAASFDSYEVEYFTRSYINGTVYDDGFDV